MNRFQRCASNYAYYGYINLHSPAMLRNYQSQRNWLLGRKGAFVTLVENYAGNHAGYEEQLNADYKVPAVISNVSMKIAWYLFLVPMFMLMFQMDDMIRVFVPHKYYYAGKPAPDGEQPPRYESMYIIDRLPKF